MVAFGAQHHFVQKKARQQRVGRNQIEMRCNAGLNPFDDRFLRVSHGSKYRLRNQPCDFGDNPLEKLLLGAEVVVQHGMRHARPFGNDCRAGSVKSLQEKLLFGRLKNQLLRGRFFPFVHSVFCVLTIRFNKIVNTKLQ